MVHRNRQKHVNSSRAFLQNKQQDSRTTNTQRAQQLPRAAPSFQKK
jgi:hypothetical protein